MMANIPSMNFFTEARMLEFWGYVRAILMSASPMVMLGVAIFCVGLVITIIIRAFRQAQDDDQDEDFDIKHY